MVVRKQPLPSSVRGYPLEEALYKNMTLTELVQRLLDKRCITFMDDTDFYLLLSGQRGEGGFTKIGTPMEVEPVILKNCLSYDEMKLSAFLSVSSLTDLINDGNRHNYGVYEKDRSRIQHEGVVVGLIGARFEKPLCMEYQDVVITPQQNIPENGYGYSDKELGNLEVNQELTNKIEKRKLWQRFYEENDFVYVNGLKDNPRFGNCCSKESQSIFDTVIMKKRYAITFDTLLLEAQTRANMGNNQAYIHVVGIGLGVWKIAEQQRHIFLETFSQRVRHLLPILNNIGVLHFSWFHITEWYDLQHNGFIESTTHPLGGIRVFMANRNPADKLRGEFENMLLVISYAWDGNALPGNEFWVGSLSGSNDPSTAASTLISELHNPHINGYWVCGENLRIVTADCGIIHISDYAGQVAVQM